MPAVFVKGDLFRHPDLGAVGHGCNCAGAMGRGIAAQFRSRYPEMFVEYKRRCALGQFGLGDVFAWVEGGITIYNLGTQRTWKTKADLSAIDRAVRSMVRLAEEAGIRKIGLPKIGAGLGGLRWADVRAVLSKIGNESKVELVIFEEFAPVSGESATSSRGT